MLRKGEYIMRIKRVNSYLSFFKKITFGCAYALLIVCLFLMMASDTWAKRTIKGKIIDEDGKPGAGLEVHAYDQDKAKKDTLMGKVKTDGNGVYAISYKGGHWDSSLGHKDTSWRPDIYIAVFEHQRLLKKSDVYRDVKLKDDIVINVQIPAIRYIEGNIVDQNKKSVEGICVIALDDDRESLMDKMSGLHESTPGSPIPSEVKEIIGKAAKDEKADFLGFGMTDKNGKFNIAYRGGHWDKSLSHKDTRWRPDIYIIMFKKNAKGKWSEVGRSGIRRDHTLREKLVFKDEPVQIP